MAYSIELTRAAAKGLNALPVLEKERLLATVDALVDEPRPARAMVLKGSKGLRRIRVGSYRVIYRIEEDAQIILIVAAGHRKDVYRKL